MQKDGKSTHLRTESDSTNQLSDLNIINSQKTVEIFKLKTGSEAGHHFETINDTIKVSDEKAGSQTNVAKTPTPAPGPNPGDLLSTDRVQNLDSKDQKPKVDIEPVETEEQDLIEKQSPTKTKLQRKQTTVLTKNDSFYADQIGNEYDNEDEEVVEFNLVDKNTNIYFDPIVKDLPDLTFYDKETYGDNPQNLESIIPKEPEEKIS